MSYELNALIGATDLLKVVAAEVPVARVARLEQDLALIPMTAGLYEALDQPSSASDLGYARFPGGFSRRLDAWSQAGPLAYAEAAYFGGIGTQRAAVWEDGRLVLGLLQLDEGVPHPPEGSPISQALRRLGAQRGQEYDEFAAVGLGRHRRLADWSVR